MKAKLPFHFQGYFVNLINFSGYRAQSHCYWFLIQFFFLGGGVYVYWLFDGLSFFWEAVRTYRKA